jgi:GT2 family glycosyltransferase
LQPIRSTKSKGIGEAFENPTDATARVNAAEFIGRVGGLKTRLVVDLKPLESEIFQPHFMRISAIISNFNGARFLPRLLASLRGQIGVEVEIVVVDRESTDDSHRVLSEFESVIVLNEPPECGLVAGYAAGVRAASADLLFFCDEEMWFDSECLDRLAHAIDLSRRIGATDPWQWSYNAREWLHGITRFAPSPWAMDSPHPFRKALVHVQGSEGTQVPFPSGGAFLIHRTVYEELGGWDPSFSLDHEAVDLFLRAWQRGWKCVSIPSAKAYRAVTGSNGQITDSIKQPISRSRYISQRANLGIIALKYFSAPTVPLAALHWPVVLMNNLLKGRFQQALWDVAVPGEFWRRLRPALDYRRANAPHNFYHPGERFFFDPIFDQSSISRE